jgi:hypothetical protein
MKNIAFLGHSICCWANYEIFGQKSYIDLVVDHFKFNLVSIGVREGSEERILDTLKRLKKVDIAIIFHSRAKCLYIPGCNRDIDLTKFDQTKGHYLYCNQTINNARLEEEFFSFGNIKEEFKDIDSFLQTIMLYKTHLYSPEIHQNKFYGALLQIDQVCKFRNIKCIHVPVTDNIPHWFRFTSGECHPEIQELANNYRESGYPNFINSEGQSVIAEKLIGLIEHL